VRWPILIGKVRQQPATGRWHEWKQQIADDCEGRCVYCAIPEARFGGIRNFHVEHFRPKIKFPALENTIGNLYVACAICNVLKSDDWPCEPAANHSRAAYPDPSHTDFNALFVVSTKTHAVDSATVARRYLVQKLVLNRAQLILERRLGAVLRFREEFDAWINQSISKMTPTEVKTVVRILQDIGQVYTGALTARPYRDADTKRAAARGRRKTRAHRR
jgi:hypothetical protein